MEQLVIGIFAGIISYYATQRIPEVSTNIDFLQYANQPAVRFVIILAVGWYALSLAVGWVRRRRKVKRRSASVAVARRPPRIRYSRWEGVVRQFGVDWQGEYGKPRSSSDSVAVVKGPYCPECGAELMKDKKERYLRSDKRIWKCPGCSFRTTRPKEYLYEEKDAVSRRIERDLEVDKNRLDDLAPGEG